MDDAAIGVAVKNSILFALLVLIAHYAIRNVLGDRSSDSSSSMVAEDGSVASLVPKPKTVTFALDKNVEIDPPPVDRISPKADPLYDYVFGGGSSVDASGATALASVKVAGKAAAAATTSGGGGDTTTPIAGDHRGCLVVGQYSNENELCGGKLFDTGSLQGHDGVFSNSFSAWA